MSFRIVAKRLCPDSRAGILYNGALVAKFKTVKQARAQLREWKALNWEPGRKQCRKCGMYKEKTAFYWRCSAKKTRHVTCKTCQVEGSKAYYARNREEILAGKALVYKVEKLEASSREQEKSSSPRFAPGGTQLVAGSGVSSE